MRRMFCWLRCLILGHEWIASTIDVYGKPVVTLKVCTGCGRRDWRKM